MRILAALLTVCLSLPLSAQSKGWTFWAGVDLLFAHPGARSSAPTLMADRGPLHLEVRSGYEAERTGSAWGGWNLRSADGESWSVTPMLGAVFGETHGTAAGLEAIWQHDAIDFYAEAEHVFSTHKPTADFTYAWSELAISPAPWLRTGVAAQWYADNDAERTLLRGALIGISHDDLSLTAYLFEPGTDEHSVVITVAREF